MSLVNKEKFITDILIADFKGNQTECADSLGISRGYLYIFLNDPNKNAGHKIMNAIYEYCKEKGKRPEDYFFPKLNN